MGSKPRKGRYWYEIRNGRVRVDTHEKTAMAQVQEILEEIKRSEATPTPRRDGAIPQRSKRERPKSPTVLAIEETERFFAPYMKDTMYGSRLLAQKEWREAHPDWMRKHYNRRIVG